MNFLEFVFKLLWQFIVFESGRWEELREKAFAWRNKVEKEAADPETPPEKLLWYHRLIKHDNEWYVQLGLAVFFLFAVKTVREWLLTDSTSYGDEDEDEDEDDDIPTYRMRQPVNGRERVVPTGLRM